MYFSIACYPLNSSDFCKLAKDVQQLVHASKTILKFSIFKSKSLFISGEFSILNVIAFYVFLLQLKKIPISGEKRFLPLVLQPTPNSCMLLESHALCTIKAWFGLVAFAKYTLPYI